MADDTKRNESNVSLTTSKDVSNVHYQSLHENDFRVYKWRWYMALVVCLVNMANALVSL